MNGQNAEKDKNYKYNDAECMDRTGVAGVAKNRGTVPSEPSVLRGCRSIPVSEMNCVSSSDYVNMLFNFMIAPDLEDSFRAVCCLRMSMSSLRKCSS